MASFGPYVAGLRYIPLISICIGCSCTAPQSEYPGTSPNSQNVALDSISAEDLLGRYTVTDYVRYRGGLTPESWAKDQIGQHVVLAKDICQVVTTTIRRPHYATYHYPDFLEGEVPVGERRLLTDFYGLGVERDGVIVLRVFSSTETNSPSLMFEIIDRNVLWITEDGWVLQLRREGCRGTITPVSERLVGSTPSGK